MPAWVLIGNTNIESDMRPRSSNYWLICEVWTGGSIGVLRQVTMRSLSLNRFGESRWVMSYRLPRASSKWLRARVYLPITVLFMCAICSFHYVLNNRDYKWVVSNVEIDNTGCVLANRHHGCLRRLPGINRIRRSYSNHLANTIKSEFNGILF